ncbi:MAG: hypothetical protein ACXVZ4_14000, partial [Gaiellaceae bacterium]
MTAPRYAGWIEARWLARRGLWRVRLRYRVGVNKLTEAELLLEADDEQAAKERGAELLADARHELTKRLTRDVTPLSQRGELLTLEEWYEDGYQERLAGAKSSYQVDVRAHWGRNIGPFIGGLTLAEFVRSGRQIGREWIKALEQEGRKRPTIEKALNVARGILSEAIREGVLEPAKGVHPFKYVDLPRKQFVEEVEFALSLEQWVGLAWLAPGSLRHTLWLELVGTEALRQQEVAPLLWTDLLRADGTARKTIAVTKAVSGRGLPRLGRGDPGAMIDTLKSAREGRRSPELFPAIGALAELVWRSEGKPGPSGARAFSASGRLGIQDIDNYRDDFWKAALADGIALKLVEQDGRYGHVTPHRGRGCASSAYGHAGWDEARLRLHVGHRELTTTLDWYFRAREEPDPELEGMPIDAQIRRARARAVPLLERHVALLGERVEEARQALGRA